MTAMVDGLRIVESEQSPLLDLGLDWDGLARLEDPKGIR
jgi:hypothetical protein